MNYDSTGEERANCDNLSYQELLNHVANMEQRLKAVEESLRKLTSVTVNTPMNTMQSKPEVIMELDPLENIRQWYNQLWETGANLDSVLMQIHASIQRQPSACVIGFRDDAAYLNDRSYAEFTCNRNGRMFVLPVETLAEGVELFAVLPYPANDIWYQRGVTMIERIYSVAGNRNNLNPHVRIDAVALLKGEKPTNVTELEMVYRPYKLGTMTIDG